MSGTPQGDGNASLAQGGEEREQHGPTTRQGASGVKRRASGRARTASWHNAGILLITPCARHPVHHNLSSTSNIVPAQCGAVFERDTSVRAEDRQRFFGSRGGERHGAGAALAERLQAVPRRTGRHDSGGAQHLHRAPARRGRRGLPRQGPVRAAHDPRRVEEGGDLLRAGPPDHDLALLGQGNAQVALRRGHRGDSPRYRPRTARRDRLPVQLRPRHCSGSEGREDGQETPDAVRRDPFLPPQGRGGDRQAEPFADIPDADAGSGQLL